MSFRHKAKIDELEKEMEEEKQKITKKFENNLRLKQNF
jgi:hypothetical protein